MIQFYAPDIKETSMLDEQESIHCSRVLRKKEGDLLRITDGKGYIYIGEIVEAHPRHTMVRIIEETFVEKEWPYRIVVAVAPTKSMDRMEWLVEKLVEIGVDEICLLKCEHSERKIVKAERLAKIMLSAMNQSLKSRLPLLTEMMNYSEFIGNYKNFSRFVGYCDDDCERKDFSDVYLKNGGDVVILIGPEGDFSPKEITSAIEEGYVPVTFGDNRLRTETAALYGAQAVHIINHIKKFEKRTEK